MKEVPDLGGERDSERPNIEVKCRVCMVPVGNGSLGSTGICSRCAHKEHNISETGRADQRRVWNISRHERRRLAGMSRSRQGR